MDLSNCSLELLDEHLMAIPKRMSIAGNPLDCACSRTLATKYAERIVDRQNATCLRKQREAVNGSIAKQTVPLMMAAQPSGECNKLPLLPLGSELIASLGDYFSIYCLPRTSNFGIEWTLQNGSKVIAFGSGVDEVRMFRYQLINILYLCFINLANDDSEFCKREHGSRNPRCHA